MTDADNQFWITENYKGCDIGIAVQYNRFSDSVATDFKEFENKGATLEVGAEVCFIGKVRASEPPVEGAHDAVNTLAFLELEHYSAMTQAALSGICQQAIDRWQLINVSVIHRIGRLDIGEPIVKVYVASQHRKQAYEACQFVMDFLKTEAPFWKKAVYTDGKGHWVEQKLSDLSAAESWLE